MRRTGTGDFSATFPYEAAVGGADAPASRPPPSQPSIDPQIWRETGTGLHVEESVTPALQAEDNHVVVSYSALSPGLVGDSRKRAKGTASVLYGVIGIMTADLAYEPGVAPMYAEAVGALLVGLAMALTHSFVELAQDEARRGSHLSFDEALDLSRSSLLVMAFPTFVAALIMMGQVIGLPSGVLARWLPYVSVVTVMGLGFGSSYTLDRRLGLALLRAVSWTLVSLLLFGAKQLGW